LNKTKLLIKEKKKIAHARMKSLLFAEVMALLTQINASYYATLEVINLNNLHSRFLKCLVIQSIRVLSFILFYAKVSVAQDGECGGNEGVLDKTTNTLLPAVDKTQKTLLGDKTASVDETKSKTPPLQLGVAKKNIGIT